MAQAYKMEETNKMDNNGGHVFFSVKENNAHNSALDLGYTEAYITAKNSTNKDLLLSAGFNASNCLHVWIYEMWTRNVDNGINKEGTQV